MKAKPEMIEGTEAWHRFESAMKRVLTVPRSELQRRIEAENEQAAKNPVKRGSKPGVLNHVPARRKPKA